MSEHCPGRTVLRAALTAILASASLAAVAATQPPKRYVPEVGEVSVPAVWNGDLRDLPHTSAVREGESLFVATEHRTPAELKEELHRFHGIKIGGATSVIAAPAPTPIANFAGMSLYANGAGWPPDTNGDVGPAHYVQVVNSSVGIYDKATGAALATVSLDGFFPSIPTPVGNACDTGNMGDPVVLYDAMADRWLITDFAWFNDSGPYYQCIAVSQTGNPLSGGWYYYALRADTGALNGYLNDYPKLGVWPDGYYMAANMFGADFAVRIWALDRSAMLAGAPMTEVHFDLCQDGSCGSFLPANLRGSPPPAGSPAFFATAAPPNDIALYRFHADFATPASSTLTGPIFVPVTPYSSFDEDVPELGGTSLDTVGFRLMAQLQYRNFGGHEALFATHTIDVGGRATARWYEIRDPAGTPTLYQEGDHSVADGRHRWMASIAADRDGDVAIGYSVSSSSMYPAIGYAGRRAGETLGELPQTERVLINGTGAQDGISRWGDYSGLSVDPTDDCTFWYTTEYYASTGWNWRTRIGSFKFPSCGQPKGTLDGHVVDAVSGAPISGAPVQLDGAESLSTTTDDSGGYSVEVLPGTYSIGAGPLPPGYPTPNTVDGKVLAAGSSITTDIPLTPAPALVAGALWVDDSAGGNGNGAAEPGEADLHVTIEVRNDGASTSHGVSAVLSSPDPNVSIQQSSSTYADIAAGASQPNDTDFVVSLSLASACGADAPLHLAVDSTEGSYAFDVFLPTGLVRPRVTIFGDAFESGAHGWTTGGSPNTWVQTTEGASSPSHSWTDSPGGDYVDDTTSYLVSPVFDLSGRTHVQVSASYTWDLEAGFDYVYLDYSTDGGSTWQPTALARFNGTQTTFTQVDTDASPLDGQAEARLRYRLVSDANVVADGIHIDDFSISYQLVACYYPSFFRDGFETGDSSQWSSTSP